MKTISDKIAELGGELAPPADSNEIVQLEARIGISLPEGLRELLRQHNGSLKDTDNAMWRFWPCDEITTHSRYRSQDEFCPDKNDLRTIDPLARTVKLPGSNLILFVDSLIDAPTYGVFHLPGHPYDDFVFDTSYNYISARSFDDWIAMFIERGEEGLLFPEPPELEQDASGNWR